MDDSLAHTDLVITEVDGESRLDSRLIAKRLDIEHKAFMETIRKYQTDFEDLGKVPFKTEASGRTNQQSKFAMLNEDQAIFASTLSRNSKKVVAFKLALTKAFKEARKTLQGVAPSAPLPEIHKFTEMLADRAMKNLSRVPDSFFAVLPHLFYQLQTLEQLTGNLDEDAKLEISVGKHWRFYAIDHLHLTDSQMVQYPHILANGRTVQAWAYADIKSGDFYKWLWTIYFPENFPSYVEYRKDKLALPAPKQQRQIKGE